MDKARLCFSAWSALVDRTGGSREPALAAQLKSIEILPRRKYVPACAPARPKTGLWNIAHNVGGFLAPIVAGTAAKLYGWKWGEWLDGRVGGWVDGTWQDRSRDGNW